MKTLILCLIFLSLFTFTVNGEPEDPNYKRPDHTMKMIIDNKIGVHYERIIINEVCSNGLVFLVVKGYKEVAITQVFERVLDKSSSVSRYRTMSLPKECWN